MSVNLKGVFTREAVAGAFDTLPALKTTVVDRAFNQAVNHPLATIGVAEIKRYTGTVPVVRRGGNPVRLDSGGADAMIVAPLPVMPSIEITAAEINDLKVILGDRASRDIWLKGKVDELRRVVRATTEAKASIVLSTGKDSWIVANDSGREESFEVDFGEVQKITATKITKDSSLSQVYDLLDDMAEAIENDGYSNTQFFAGKTFFGILIELAKGWSDKSSSPITVKLEQNTINLGGYLIERMAEKYKHPTTGVGVSKVDDDDLIGYASDVGKVFYPAVDSLSADNRGVPFSIFVKEIDDRAIQLIAQSKPLLFRPSNSTRRYSNK